MGSPVASDALLLPRPSDDARPVCQLSICQVPLFKPYDKVSGVGGGGRGGTLVMAIAMAALTGALTPSQPCRNAGPALLIAEPYMW